MQYWVTIAQVMRLVIQTVTINVSDLVTLTNDRASLQKNYNCKFSFLRCSLLCLDKEKIFQCSHTNSMIWLTRLSHMVVYNSTCTVLRLESPHDRATMC